MNAGRRNMTFAFIEHTADMRMECHAASLEGLLTTAADGLYALALRRVRHETSVERAVTLDAADTEDLLVRWLQELIYLMESEHIVAAQREFSEVSQGRLRATLRGYVCAAEERAVEVKSATYHGLEVLERPGDYAARVTFDL